MKKDYFKPAMRVVEMRQRQILCNSDPTPASYSINSNLGDDDFDYAGGGNGEGR